MYRQVSSIARFDSGKDSCFDRYGYVIAVTSLDNIGVGRIQPGMWNEHEFAEVHFGTKVVAM